MRFSVFLLFTFIFLGCGKKSSDPYDPKNYILLKTDSFNNRIGMQYFVFKDDTSRKLQINYWDNGNLLSTGFTYRGKMDGKFEMYDFSGKIMVIDSFIEGKKVFEKTFYKKDTTVKIFRNGKSEPFNSIDSLLK